MGFGRQRIDVRSFEFMAGVPITYFVRKELITLHVCVVLLALDVILDLFEVIEKKHPDKSL